MLCVVLLEVLDLDPRRVGGHRRCGGLRIVVRSDVLRVNFFCLLLRFRHRSSRCLLTLGAFRPLGTLRLVGHFHVILEHFLEELFVVLCPRFYWQFSDLNRPIGHRRDLANKLESALPVWLHRTCEPAVSRDHIPKWLPAEETAEVVHNVPGVVRRDVGGPTCADTLSSVYEDQRNDWTVPFWFNFLPLLCLVVKERVVVSDKQFPCVVA